MFLFGLFLFLFFFRPLSRFFFIFSAFRKILSNICFTLFMLVFPFGMLCSSFLFCRLRRGFIFISFPTFAELFLSLSLGLFFPYFAHVIFLFSLGHFCPGSFSFSLYFTTSYPIFASLFFVVFPFGVFFSIFLLCYVPFFRSVTFVMVLFHFFYALYHPLQYLPNFFMFVVSLACGFLLGRSVPLFSSVVFLFSFS